MELLAPAGSMEALRAAVCNGADAVYLGAGTFNARMNARNFSAADLQEAIVYCHVRGVKVHLTLNTLVLDREMQRAADLIRMAAAFGVDAFIVQDLGVVSLCKEIAPDVPVHASTQMSIHSLEGVLEAAALGCSRVVLSRELPASEIAYICKKSPVEIEVFAHGALCMCYSGQCYLSSVIGRRSGNRGQCAQRVIKLAGRLCKAIRIDGRCILALCVERVARDVDRHDVLIGQIQRCRLLWIQQRLLQHLRRHDARSHGHRPVGLLNALLHLGAQLLIFPHDKEKLAHQLITLILE